MVDFKGAREFLQGEVEALDAFDFVALGPAGAPLQMVEITRDDDPTLEVRVPGRPPMVPPLSDEIRSALAEQGYASEDADDPAEVWRKPASSPRDAVDLALTLIADVFQAKPEPRLDVLHGNHRAAHDARKLLSDLRERIERVAEDVIGSPAEQDHEGDYLLPIADVQVVISPRILPNGPAVVRVFSVTNVQVNVVPELGLFLARMNFSLLFGRFTLDVDRKTIIFDEALLGDPLNEEALRFSIRVVAEAADEWDDRLKQMFGGSTYQEVLKQQGRLSAGPPTKPGSGDEHQPGHGLYL
jgi:hypothetical protein